MTLLEKIRDAALDSSVPLPDLLRKCKVLAARLKHAEFAAWVGHELNGYSDGDSLPAYRIARVSDSRGNFVGGFGGHANNFPLPLGVLPDELQQKLREHHFIVSVGTLAALVEHDGELRIEWPGNVVAYVANNHPMVNGMILVSAWRNIGPGVVTGILDTIRTRILDFVLAIETESPNAGENAPDKPATITPAALTQVFHTTIVGGQAIVGTSGGKALIGSGNVAKGKVAGRDISEPRQLLPLLQKLRKEAEKAPVSAAERAEAVELVEKMKKGAKAPKHKFNADRLLKYLTVYSTIVTTASTTLPQLEHGLKHLASLMGLT